MTVVMEWWYLEMGTVGTDMVVTVLPWAGSLGIFGHGLSFLFGPLCLYGSGMGSWHMG